MDPATIIGFGKALIESAPAIESLVKQVAASFSSTHGLDSVAITQAISPDRHTDVDALIDAKIEAKEWPTK
jgi:hypothetical protein